MMNNWQEFQIHSYRDWNYFYDTKENFDTEDDIPFKELIAKSFPVEIKNIEIECEPFDGINIYFKFLNFQTKAYLFWGDCDVRSIWWFLEALLSNREKIYCSINEEGPECFFYVEQMENNKIRFVHISDSYNKNLDFEPYSIKQDFIIDKNIFINKFAEQLFKIIKVRTEENISRLYGGDEFHLYIQESEVFEKMYKEYKIKENEDDLFLENYGLGYPSKEEFEMWIEGDGAGFCLTEEDYIRRKKEVEKHTSE